MLMAKKVLLTDSGVIVTLLAPALVAGIAVLIQIRDGKGTRSEESAINEARKLIYLSTPPEKLSEKKKA
jgi:hypothetical protein